MLLRFVLIAGLVQEVFACVSASSAVAAALLVGVDKYTDGAIADLPAAARDAEDLAGALRTAGQAPVVLTGTDATKSRIFDAFSEIVSRSAPNEPIIFAFSGHGSRVRDENHDEQDGLDEVLLLSGASMDEPSLDQMILDDEIDALVRQAAPRPVIIIADSCYSGTVVRSIDPRISPPPQRFQPLVGPVRGLGKIKLPDPPQFVARAALFAAINEDLEVGEVLIDGEHRGALSWATARGFEGAADGGDGVLTVAELADYVARTATAVSDGRQTPLMDIPAEIGDVVLARYPFGRVGSSAEQALAHAPLPVALRGIANAPADLGRLNVVVVQPEMAQLTLDAGTGEVITASGDIAVDLTPGWTTDAFGAVVEKYRFLRLLSRNVDARVTASLSDGPRIYRDGESLRVEIESDVPGDLLLFAVLADGSVVRIGSAPQPIAVEESLSFPLRVGPPLGGDHIIAVVTSKAAEVEHWIDDAAGRSLDDETSAAFAKLLSVSSAMPLGIYTGPR